MSRRKVSTKRSSKPRLHVRTERFYHHVGKTFSGMDTHGIERRPTKGKMSGLLKKEFGG